MMMFGKAILLFCAIASAVYAEESLEAPKVDPSEYTIIERARTDSTHDFYGSTFQHGDTWITELQLKSPPVRIPLVREDSSNYSDAAGYVGVIDDLNDRQVSVTWIVPKVVMCISWESTVPPGRMSYSGYVLVALTDSKASVLQRVFGSYASMSAFQDDYTRVDYTSLGKDSSGHYKIRRTVTVEEDAHDSSVSYQTRQGSESSETMTVYALEDGSLKELSHVNRFDSRWDDKPTSLDQVVDRTWSKVKANKEKSEEEKLRFKKAILKQNPDIRDEEHCPLPLVIPSQDPIALPLELKDMDYPYNEVTGIGWLDVK
jgi:hypothetical protein